MLVSSTAKRVSEKAKGYLSLHEGRNTSFACSIARNADVNSKSQNAGNTNGVK